MFLLPAVLLSFAPHTFHTPTVEIAPGVHLPLVGIGTWQYNNSVTEAAVLSALSMGYEHVDTALGYENAAGVARALAKSGRTRASYFITSKIPGGLGETVAAAALASNLAALQLDYVDLMLVHFPATWGGAGGKAARQAEWAALEAFVRAGKARAIGVSHYCRRHLEEVLQIATLKPAINQVEFHVGMGTAGPLATDDRAWMQQQGVTFQSFSPLCGPCGAAEHAELVTGELVRSVGRKYGKSGAQVALKWQVQQQIPVIPKAQHPAYQKENLDLFGWELSQEDFDALTRATTPAVSGANGTSGDCAVP